MKFFIFQLQFSNSKVEKSKFNLRVSNSKFNLMFYKVELVAPSLTSLCVTPFRNSFRNSILFFQLISNYFIFFTIFFYHFISLNCQKSLKMLYNTKMNICVKYTNLTYLISENIFLRNSLSINP